jgi:hypothetical protein
MYLFARRFWGAGGGLLSALVYVYAPYHVYTEPYARGDYPELLAFALFPFILWRFQRLFDPAPSVARFDLAWAALSLGLLILTHNLMALVMAAFIGVWLLWGTLATRRLMGRAWLALVLGVALPAYFWLPVLAEREAVQLQNLIDVAELDYRHFFIPLSELLAPSPLADGGARNGLQPRYNLGVAAWFLGGAGALSLLTAYFGRRQALDALRHHSDALFFLLMGLGLAFLITPASAFVWEALPLLAYLQFPWRFLGVVGACAAFLAGACWPALLRFIPPPFWQKAALGLLCFIPLAASLPTLYVPQWDLQRLDTSVAAYHAEENAGRQRGTTFSGEFLPRSVFVVAGGNQRLLADFADGPPVNPLHIEALPDGVGYELLHNGPQETRWRFTSPQDFRAEALIFDFVGWRVEVNGQPVDITPSNPHGFITFPVPAGEAEVRLWLGATPSRRVGVAISVLAGVTLLIVSVVEGRAKAPPAMPAPDEGLLSVSVAVFILFSLFLALTYRAGLAWLDSPLGRADRADQPLNISFGDDIRLLGYDLRREGRRLALNLYWYADRTPQAGYAVFVHVARPQAPPSAQSDKANPGGEPTLTWRPSDGYIFDAHRLSLPPDLPAGRYEVRVGLWTCDGLPPDQPCGNGLRLAVQTAEGRRLGDSFLLAELTLP